MRDYGWMQGVIRRVPTVRKTGRVRRVVGIMIESDGPPAQVGELCRICGAGREVLAEVVSFQDGQMLMIPLGRTDDIRPQDTVIGLGESLHIPVSEAMLGGIFDALARPLDGQTRPAADWYPVEAQPPPPLERPRIREPLALGVRAIDGLLTCGKGQRLGIVAGTGLGKSVLMGMIARNTQADVKVIGLVGERGREVKEFIERDLGHEGLARSVVIAATSDQPPLMRLRAAYTATAVAEFFRDRGQDVLLMIDSLTRVAWAQRDIGLACGEPPTRNGYTPSVFTMLPRLLERAGTSKHGTITALYTILVEADDISDPVGDAARAVLDGHIVLSRRLAEQGHYPAIDILQSISRLMVEITDREHQLAALRVREAMAEYARVEDLINLGAYTQGRNQRIDRAIALREPILEFLRQGQETRTEFAETIAWLKRIVSERSQELRAAA